MDPVLVIISLETGVARELPRTLSYLVAPRWAPDGRSLAAVARSIDLQYFHPLKVGIGGREISLTCFRCRSDSNLARRKRCSSSSVLTLRRAMS